MSEIAVPDLGTCSDDVLAEALLARRPGAILAAWQRFQPLVYRILRGRMGSSDLVDDIAQDVFLCFFRNVQQLRNPRALRPFVVTLATRTLTNELRRWHRRQRFMVDADLQVASVVGERADSFSRHAAWRLDGLMSRMRERDRKVLVLCLVQHRQVDEAAKLLGVSLPTARRSLARVRLRLARIAQSDPFLCEFAGLALKGRPDNRSAAE